MSRRSGAACVSKLLNLRFLAVFAVSAAVTRLDIYRYDVCTCSARNENEDGGGALEEKLLPLMKCAGNPLESRLDSSIIGCPHINYNGDADTAIPMINK